VVKFKTECTYIETKWKWDEELVQENSCSQDYVIRHEHCLKDNLLEGQEKAPKN